MYLLNQVCVILDNYLRRLQTFVYFLGPFVCISWTICGTKPTLCSLTITDPFSISMSLGELWGRMDVRAFSTHVEPLPHLNAWDIDMLDFDFPGGQELGLITPPADRSLDVAHPLVGQSVDFDYVDASGSRHVVGRRRSLSFTSRGWEASFISSSCSYSRVVPNMDLPTFDPTWGFGPGQELFFSRCNCKWCICLFILRKKGPVI